ncbi:dockerin type I domain-containing protein [Paenibacillus sp. OK003]|uniref:dockerin type I domain-containing protein n=1 Tax=Paenibacillus sp. OK003 TaxID=1884380 RepID=UPI0008CB69EE|nr:dockerin type I domain-containing protein [Paenibacillus sp. OK003]SEK30544.1 Ig-like domain-containing protein [Paenibacillus sp. OK003]
MKDKPIGTRFAPLMKKSMLTALGLGIALPLGSTIPSVQAGAPSSQAIITAPVLNEDINWLAETSATNGSEQRSIVVDGSFVTVDLMDYLSSFDLVNDNELYAESNDTSVASARVREGHLIVQIQKAGTVTIKLLAKHTSGTSIQDHLELQVTKQGDTNGDGKVDSRDAKAISDFLNTPRFRGPTMSELNRMDVNRDSTLNMTDLSELFRGYTQRSLGATDNHYVLTFKQIQDAPYAVNAELTGEMKMGSTITGTYNYLDLEGDDQGDNPLYQWYSASDVTGIDKQEITGATSKEYLIRVEDIGKYLFLKITPQAMKGEIKGEGVIVGGTAAVTQGALSADVQSLSPVNGTTGVGVNDPLVITYTVPVYDVPQRSGIYIKIRDLTENQIVKEYSVKDQDYTINDNIVTITNPGLTYGHQYSIEVPWFFFYGGEDSHYVNPIGLSTLLMWTFTTEEGPPPTP